MAVVFVCKKAKFVEQADLMSEYVFSQPPTASFLPCILDIVTYETLSAILPNKNVTKNNYYTG